MSQGMAEHKKNRSRRKREYQKMRSQFPPQCWACSAEHQPHWWGHAPWLPNERAHITRGTRLEDRRCVVLLCSCCHKLYDGGLNLSHQNLENKLTVEILLEIKKEFDPEFFDFDLLQACSIRKLKRSES